jgi:hypothetical protein
MVSSGAGEMWSCCRPCEIETRTVSALPSSGFAALVSSKERRCGAAAKGGGGPALVEREAYDWGFGSSFGFFSFSGGGGCFSGALDSGSLLGLA